MSMILFERENVSQLPIDSRLKKDCDSLEGHMGVNSILKLIVAVKLGE